MTNRFIAIGLIDVGRSCGKGFCVFVNPVSTVFRVSGVLFGVSKDEESQERKGIAVPYGLDFCIKTVEKKSTIHNKEGLDMRQMVSDPLLFGCRSLPKKQAILSRSGTSSVPATNSVNSPLREAVEIIKVSLLFSETNVSICGTRLTN